MSDKSRNVKKKVSFRFSQDRRDQIIKLLAAAERHTLCSRDLSADGQIAGAQIESESAYLALMNIRTLLLKGFEPE